LTAVVEQVRRAIEEHHLLEFGATAVIGVSGGPDSLTLLYVLGRLAGEYNLALHVAHLNHRLRGTEADADEAYVRELATSWGLPASVERADVASISRDHGLAIEEAARRARYSFLGRVAREVGARYIAVGHNADDQAETVLMHWIRGSGLAGLRGMLPRTQLTDYRLLDDPFPGTEDLWLIRPLLGVTRAEVEDYCNRHGLQPRFDRSNLDITYFRNWLRHRVIPLLEQHNPNVREVMRRSALVIADDYALLRSLLEEVWPGIVREEVVPQGGADGDAEGRILFDLPAWRALPTSLQRSAIREAIHRLRRSLRNISFVHVENAVQVGRDGSTGAESTLPRGLMLTVGYDHLMVAQAGAELPLPDRPLLPAGHPPVPVLVPGASMLQGSEWVLWAAVMERDDLPADWEANAEPWRAFLDLETVGTQLRLRTRLPGDRFQPLGMAGHSVKLGDFLTNEKVPRAARDQLPLLEAEWGICWVCGHRIDRRARVTPETRHVLYLHFVPQGDSSAS
jgi:tRNA(Ile)-lysidine synthase